MKCYHCRAEVVWGGDHDYDISDLFVLVSNYSCPNCGAFIEVYIPPEDHNGQDES